LPESESRPANQPKSGKFEGVQKIKGEMRSRVSVCKMKILIAITFVCLLGGPSFSQNELQNCAEKKNKLILKSLTKKMDSAAHQKYIQSDIDWQNCIISKSIPRFRANTLNNEKINSEKLKGKIIVINFWFIGCPPCVAEMPALNQLVKEYRDSGVIFLGFALDDKKSLKKFFATRRFDFTIIPGAQNIEDLFGVLEHPVNFIIDRNGKIVIAWAGGETGEEAKSYAYLKIKPVLENLLKSQ